MVNGIEPLHQRIGDGIASVLPPMWHRAWMDAIFYADNVLYHGSYQAAEGGRCIDFVTTIDSEEAFQEMRTLFADTGKVPWCRVRFELQSGGKFHLLLSYDDCDVHGFARFDEAAEREWRRQLASGKAVPLLGAKPPRTGEE